MMFTKEIKKINSVMQAVADGDLTQRIPIKKKNEFGELEGNFNEMVDNVSILIKDVEERSQVIIKASDNMRFPRQQPKQQIRFLKQSRVYPSGHRGRRKARTMRRRKLKISQRDYTKQRHMSVILTICRLKPSR